MVRACRASAVVLGFLALSSLPNAQQATPPSPYQDAVQAVRARVAPDRRLVVFDVTAEQTPAGIAVRGEVESATARDAAIEAVRARANGAGVLDQLTVLPHASLGPDIHGIVRVSVANVRATPAHSAELVTQTLMGWPVRVLKRQGGWYLVHTEPDGYLGWIEDLQLARGTAAKLKEWMDAPGMIVTANSTMARTRPDREADPVTDLVIANVLKDAGKADGFRQVELPDGRRAFVPVEDVQEFGAWRSAQRNAPDAIARTAARFMGVPYLWGGTSAKGFDCSGFAKTVFHLQGIELPRDTDQQAKMGSAVTIDDTFSELRTGDLLFFGTAATPDRPERVSHVGVHVGSREFIHASGLVRRNSLDPASPIYDEGLRKRLLHIRRVLPEPRITAR
jgi:cell wall-associated NlpC family hydrolase